MLESRNAILGRIRTALAATKGHHPDPQLPDPPEVWPRTDPSREQMAARFVEELSAVHGEAIRCASMDDARARLAAIVSESGGGPVVSMDRGLCREASGALLPDAVRWLDPAWGPAEMADFQVGLIEADVLLADTGTAVIACHTAQDRLACYLPPTCVVIATSDRLAEHMPAAWEAIAAHTADARTRGEYVFITGPSRTSDIEKILIVGVHGPTRYVVLLV